MVRERQLSRAKENPEMALAPIEGKQGKKEDFASCFAQHGASEEKLVEDHALCSELVLLKRNRGVRFARSNHAGYGNHLQAAFFIERGGPGDGEFHPLSDRQLSGGLK